MSKKHVNKKEIEKVSAERREIAKQSGRVKVKVITAVLADALDGFARANHFILRTSEMKK